MAKLVVKSNTASDAFYVEQKVFQLPFTKKRVDIIITPRESHMIDAKDFGVGVLQPQISSVNFNNLNKKIIASVNLKSTIDTPKNLILDIPIYGKSFLEVDKFTIKETTSVIGDVLVNTSSKLLKSTNNNETSYTVKNPLGEKLRVFSKTFSVTNGFKFSKLPKYTITGNPTRYAVKTSIREDINKNIISKTFDFYYTSPKTVISPLDSSIVFSAAAKDSSNRDLLESENKLAKDQNTIYYIDKGKNVGPQGGTKRIVIRGVPGSAYSFIVSDVNGAMYNSKTGKLSNDGGLMTGTIPIAEDGKTYGESVVRIKVPRSAVSKTISTQFLSKEPTEIQKAKLEKATNISEINKILNQGEIKTEKTVSLTIPAITFEINTNTSALTSTSVLAAEAKSTSSESVTLAVDTTVATAAVFENKKVYKSDGTLFGTCTSVESGTSLIFGAGLTGEIANNDVLYTYPTLYLGPKIKIEDAAGKTISSQKVFIGKESREPLKVEKSDSYQFKFEVASGTANKWVEITRQPLFVMPESPDDNFVAWDEDEDQKAIAQKNDGTEIPSDWDWSAVNKSANIRMHLLAEGLGKIQKTTTRGGVEKYAYSVVLVSGKIEVGGVGKESATVELMLNNFLSIV